MKLSKEDQETLNNWMRSKIKNKKELEEALEHLEDQIAILKAEGKIE